MCQRSTRHFSKKIRFSWGEKSDEEKLAMLYVRRTSTSASTLRVFASIRIGLRLCAGLSESTCARLNSDTLTRYHLIFSNINRYFFMQKTTDLSSESDKYVYLQVVFLKDVGRLSTLKKLSEISYSLILLILNMHYLIERCMV